ncbi:MAG TPA: hypothetical protein VGA03_03385 [Anaerolineales bacterium]
MVQIDEMVWCVGCGVELTWGPVFVGKDRYCCQDCADGLKCNCGVRMEIDEDVRGSSPVVSAAAAGYND